MEKKKRESWKKVAIIIMIYSLLMVVTGSILFLKINWNKALTDPNFIAKIIYYATVFVASGLSASTIIMHIYIIHEILK